MCRAPFQVGELPNRKLLLPGGEMNLLTDQNQARVHDLLNMTQKSQRGAVVDRYNDYTSKNAAPECGNPFGTVFRPEDDFVVFAYIAFRQPRRKMMCGKPDLCECVSPAAISVIVLKVLNSGRRE